MIDQKYKDQVELLLTVLPEVAREESLAMHGGTAINLFVRDLPRVSVDIDLTFIPVEDRDRSLANITATLSRIKARVEGLNQGINAELNEKTGKLLVSRGGKVIKLEVNLVMRGIINKTVLLPLCKRAQEEYNAYTEMTIVPLGQLYGGKICAALDRQHPRDLFDTKYILEEEGFTEEIKQGFFYCLLSSERPIHEILSPQLLDQNQVMVNQFTGMTEDVFTYQEFEATRSILIESIHQNLTEQDRRFLLKFNALEPDWGIFDFQSFPSVRWKMIHLQKLKDSNPEKFKTQFEHLKSVLERKGMTQ
jgi:predicted nucleotidyltransferase component of viral defense system